MTDAQDGTAGHASLAYAVNNSEERSAQIDYLPVFSNKERRDSKLKFGDNWEHQRRNTEENHWISLQRRLLLLNSKSDSQLDWTTGRLENWENNVIKIDKDLTAEGFNCCDKDSRIFNSTATQNSTTDRRIESQRFDNLVKVQRQ
ncbi:hypothetical protein GCK72_022733 [Caenorhabditis remanei]|uniref:Uncharacterized protein n=1 Tax=Caenorhabditis remanei TaxID=31234 RepID=A0A6A5FUH3_CAERE|nr:hypothetical protein GCK72_022733 [Caenorhabditis remanei]KAF1746280.1 hypothetical protein GCK72_022733 [Caenorhabditis remanei]